MKKQFAQYQAKYRIASHYPRAVRAEVGQDLAWARRAENLPEKAVREHLLFWRVPKCNCEV